MTLRKRILFYFATTSGITILLMLTISLYFNARLKKVEVFSNEIQNLHVLFLENNRTQQNFFTYDLINPDFYIQEKSEYVKEHKENMMRMEDLLEQLETYQIYSRNRDISIKGNLLERALIDYDSIFIRIVDLQLKRGFKDWGIEGLMRSRAHAIEQTDKANFSTLLMLRRHEKDYIIRNDKKYVERFDYVISDYIESIGQNPNYDAAIRDSLIATLRDYKKFFLELVAYDDVLGIKNNSGLRESLKSKNDQIINLLEELSHEVTSISTKVITTLNRLYLIIAGLLLLLSLGVIIPLSKRLTLVIKNVAETIDYLGRTGDLLKKYHLPSDQKGEIGQMSSGLKKLISGLTNTAKYAREIEKGNYNAKYTAVSEKDVLGNSLLSMQESLQKAERESKKRKLEEEKQNWISHGLAKFNDILRMNNDDISKLGDHLVSNIVKYMHVSQAGLFLYNDDKENDHFLEQVATYAYDRKKFIEKKILLGEGLLGAVAIEKKTVYLTDIPQNYMFLESGLGDTNPRSLLLVPLIIEEKVMGVLEIASLKAIEKHEISFVENLAENIASTIGSVKTNMKTTSLLRSSQEQAEEMRAQEEEMRQNFEELQSTQEEMQRVLNQNEERIKELNGINTTTEIIRQNNKSVAEVLQEITARIPEAWQYPEHTKARIKYNKNVYAADSFDTTPWVLKKDFVTIEGKRGAVEVYYTKEFENIPNGEGPFLIEERSLINNITELITGFLNATLGAQAYGKAKDSEAKMQEKERQLKNNIDEMKQAKQELEKKSAEILSTLKALDLSTGYTELDRNGIVLFMNHKQREFLMIGEQEPIGTPFSNFLTEEKEKKYFDAISENVLQGEVMKWEHLIENEEQMKIVWLNDILAPVKDETGKIIKILILSSDVSDEKAKQQEVEEMNNKLKEKEEILQKAVLDYKKTEEDMKMQAEQLGIQEEEIKTAFSRLEAKEKELKEANQKILSIKDEENQRAEEQIENQRQVTEQMAEEYEKTIAKMQEEIKKLRKK